MRTAKIGVLKNQLSAYLRHVRNGEEVVIYDRDVPIAKIVPVDPADADDYASEKSRLIASGILKPPIDPTPMNWDAFLALPRPTVSDESVREAIEWAKGDR